MLILSYTLTVLAHLRSIINIEERANTAQAGDVEL